MTVRVYLRGTVEDLPGHETRGNGQDVQHFVMGAQVFRDGELLYFNLGDLEHAIPPGLAKFVAKVTCHEYFPAQPEREKGIYRLGRSSKAEVQGDFTSGGRAVLVVRASAKSLKTLARLVHLIRTGAIRPTESYEGPQAGLSREELEEKARALEADLGRMDVALASKGFALAQAGVTIGELSQRIVRLESELKARTNELAEADRKLGILEPLMAKVLGMIRDLERGLERNIPTITRFGAVRWALTSIADTISGGLPK